MSFFKVNKNVEAVTESGGSDFIKDSGFYDVIIKNLWVETNEHKARTIHMQIEHSGATQILFNAFRLDNNDGTPNFSADMFNKLCIVTDVDPSDPEDMEVTIGKNKKEIKKVVTDFTEEEVTLQLRNVYTRYNGKIYKYLTIYGLYRTSDKATAPEIVNNSDKMGAKYVKDVEKNLAVDIYKDDITPAEAKAYFSKDNKASTSTTTSTAPSEDSDNLFD